MSKCVHLHHYLNSSCHQFSPVTFQQARKTDSTGGFSHAVYGNLCNGSLEKLNKVQWSDPKISSIRKHLLSLKGQWQDIMFSKLKATVVWQELTPSWNLHSGTQTWEEISDRRCCYGCMSDRWFMVGRVMAPTDVHFLIPRSYACVTWHSGRYSAGVV